MIYLDTHVVGPVKWIERRREHFTSTIHGRGLVEYFDAAVKNDGTLLAGPGGGAAAEFPARFFAAYARRPPL